MFGNGCHFCRESLAGLGVMYVWIREIVFRLGIDKSCDIGHPRPGRQAGTNTNDHQ